MLKGATPILFVRDVTQAAGWWRDRLGFTVDFLHGEPPFYGGVSRDGVCLHLRFVRAPNFAALASQEQALILATIEAADVKALYAEVQHSGAEIAQALTAHAWGGTDFHVRDPDGNAVSFVTYG